MANGGKIRKGKRDEALLSSLTSRRVASLEGLGYFRAPMHDPLHINVDALYAGLDSVKLSPSAATVLDMIVRRPTVEGRELLTAAQLDETNGLVGDSWFGRGSSKTPDGSANPDAQLTIVNSRAISLIAGTRERWALAGDQLFFDLDLSTGNLPAGSRLKIGNAVIEITAAPHLGCAKFKARFGADALAFVNSEVGKELRLRGANARIIRGGMIRTGDEVRKV